MNKYTQPHALIFNIPQIQNFVKVKKDVRWVMKP